MEGILGGRGGDESQSRNQSVEGGGGSFSCLCVCVLCLAEPPDKIGPNLYGLLCGCNLVMTQQIGNIP